MRIDYPKWLYEVDGKARLVKSAAEHEALDPAKYAESPADFNERGVAVHRAPAEPDEPSAGSPYPKWLYHPDGRAGIFTREQHDALSDRDQWVEDLAQTSALRANSVSTEAPAGAALWETPAADVLEMLAGAPLATLEKTFLLEEQNPGKPRRTLLRELSRLIEQAQKDARAE